LPVKVRLNRLQFRRHPGETQFDLFQCCRFHAVVVIRPTTPTAYSVRGRRPGLHRPLFYAFRHGGVP
jgi:hypothetical protein